MYGGSGGPCAPARAALPRLPRRAGGGADARQEFRVDLALRTCLRAAGAAGAGVGDTVDYAAVYELVREHVERRPPRLLLEQLAAGICDDILAKQPRVEAVECRILKPQVAVPGIVTEGLGAPAVPEPRPLRRRARPPRARG